MGGDDGAGSDGARVQQCSTMPEARSLIHLHKRRATQQLREAPLLTHKEATSPRGLRKGYSEGHRHPCTLSNFC